MSRPSTATRAKIATHISVAVVMAAAMSTLGLAGLVLVVSWWRS